MYDILLSNATVLTMDAGAAVIDDGCVAISGNRIQAVGPQHALGDATAQTTIDCRDCVVLPGLINAHTHLPMAYFRGIADDLNLEDIPF